MMQVRWKGVLQVLQEWILAVREISPTQIEHSAVPRVSSEVRRERRVWETGAGEEATWVEEVEGVKEAAVGWRELEVEREALNFARRPPRAFKGGLGGSVVEEEGSVGEEEVLAASVGCC